MLSSTIAQPTLKSPPSDSSGLLADVMDRESLTPTDLARMYELLDSHFENTSRRQFQQDLAEKDSAILIRTVDTGTIVGFSTLMRIHVTVQQRSVVGFFSGDTIIAREHWGSSLLNRVWLRNVFSQSELLRLQSPNDLYYWFLIYCSGYRTWRYLPIFFRNYLPNPAASESSFDQQVLHALAGKKFGTQYNPVSGIIQLDQANPLRPGFAEILPPKLRDPDISSSSSVQILATRKETNSPVSPGSTVQTSNRPDSDSSERKTDQLVAAWKEKIIIFVSLAIAVTLLYFGTLHSSLFAAATVPITTLDHLIPFVPAFIIPYASFFLLILMPCFVVNNRQELRTISFGLAWIVLVSAHVPILADQDSEPQQQSID